MTVPSPLRLLLRCPRYYCCALELPTRRFLDINQTSGHTLWGRLTGQSQLLATLGASTAGCGAAAF